MKGKRVLIMVMVTVIFIIFNFSCTKQSFSYQHNVPKFTAEQNTIIKKLYPKIIDNLDQPANYFLTSVSASDTGYIVELLPLKALQTFSVYTDMKTPTSEIISVPVSHLDDIYFTFHFDTSLQIIQESTENPKAYWKQIIIPENPKEYIDKIGKADKKDMLSLLFGRK